MTTAIDLLPIDGEGFTVIRLAVLVAAQLELLQYDIARWDDEIGLASHVSFSRRKRAVEHSGVVTKESVPIGLGRPRERMRLVEEFQGMEGEELAHHTKEVFN